MHGAPVSVGVSRVDKVRVWVRVRLRLGLGLGLVIVFKFQCFIKMVSITSRLQLHILLCFGRIDSLT